MVKRAFSGPFVQAACICERVIESKLGPLSLINIIDTITVQVSGPDIPDQMPPTQYFFYLIVSLKSGTARGRHNLKVIPEHPNGESGKEINQSVLFSGEEQGVNTITQYTYLFPIEGLYWFEVFLDDDLMTKIPVRLHYLPQKI